MAVNFDARLHSMQKLTQAEVLCRPVLSGIPDRRSPFCRLFRAQGTATGLAWRCIPDRRSPFCRLCTQRPATAHGLACHQRPGRNISGQNHRPTVAALWNICCRRPGRNISGQKWAFWCTALLAGAAPKNGSLALNARFRQANITSASAPSSASPLGGATPSALSFRFASASAKASAKASASALDCGVRLVLLNIFRLSLLSHCKVGLVVLKNVLKFLPVLLLHEVHGCRAKGRVSD